MTVLRGTTEGAPSARPISVVKLGGSLLDLADLPQRLHRFLASRSGVRHLMVVGGGQAANFVRELDARFGLGDEKAHWLAVHAMAFNARLVAELIEGSAVANNLLEADALWRSAMLPILNPWEWLQAGEREAAGCSASAGELPHSWEVTSDSIAAWVARRTGAVELVLLKSAPLQCAPTIGEAVRRGLVDAMLPHVWDAGTRCTYVNLRAPCTEPRQLTFVGEAAMPPTNSASRRTAPASIASSRCP